MSQKSTMILIVGVALFFVLRSWAGRTATIPTGGYQ